MQRGVDLSNNNAGFSPGWDFYLLKASQGLDFIDGKFADYKKQAANVGKPVIRYGYYVAGLDAARQADYLIDAFPLTAGEGLMCDFEEDRGNTAAAAAYMRQLIARAPEHRALLYCNVDYWNGFHGNPVPTIAGLVLAEWNGMPGVITGTGVHADFHQFANTLAGHPLDLDAYLGAGTVADYLNATVARPPQRTWIVGRWPSWDSTLYGLANHFYGKGEDWPRIFNANRNVLANPNELNPGMVLIIP
jgi:hypothetical protein